MKKYDIPNDLKKYSENKMVKSVVLFVVLETAVLLSMIFWGDDIVSFLGSNKNINAAAKPLICIVATLLLFWFSGLYSRLFDLTFFGEVVDVSVKTTVGQETPGHPTIENAYCKNDVNLIIKTSDGKTVHKKICGGKAKYDSNPNKYKVGDKVFHLAGTKNLILISEKGDSVNCAVCDELNSKRDEKCIRCGHSLIIK